MKGKQSEKKPLDIVEVKKKKASIRTQGFPRDVSNLIPNA